jgi:tRNA threonylcarbamoyladenosine biosynthesis protein TsaB
VIVLGFDTATQATAVGLRLGDGATLHTRDDPAPDAHPGHATRLLAMAAELLAQAELRWSDVQRIAVGVGPGRFTGLRVGIATARGLAQSLSAELVGVSSLHALALPAMHAGYESDASAGRDGAGAGAESPATATIAVIDARRGEAFAGGYAGETELALPRALRSAELEGIVAQLERDGAPAGQRWRAVGDGALLYAEQLRAGGVDLAEPRSSLHRLDGAAVCELGASAVPEAAGDAALATVLPDYRRSPDAKLARGARPPVSGVSRA